MRLRSPQGNVPGLCPGGLRESRQGRPGPPALPEAVFFAAVDLYFISMRRYADA